ncbi:Adenosine/AMP deaminase domain containing protein [Aphelenchoides avenae]|nr:Adenosine/AMP deaminase domain containing protein [Aphelenchus avenae]
MPEPADYEKDENPPYAYYAYYLYANLVVLNAFRSSDRTAEKPGQKNHMACGFLLADNINHGLELNRAPVLQYLFYLAQIGISMSPIGNRHLFDVALTNNPFKPFFCRGLRVCLSTDDPLQFHDTKEPLAEEYSNARNSLNLSQTDMCEIARNSVLISGFEDGRKKQWLGETYKEEGVAGNDIEFTNVPDIRVSFRQEALEFELNELFKASRRATQ